MEINKLIDHTLLKPNATEEDIIELCKEAIVYNFKAVCVNPYYVPLAKNLLKGSDVLVCTVVGFPLGATFSEAKVDETKRAIKAGADEIDVVLNIGKVKEQNFEFVQEEIRLVKEACKGRLLKVILETAFLSDDEIFEASKACVLGGADFVKTSTGFASGGALVEHVKIMREAVGPYVGVKASGGIRSRSDLEKMVASGATRIGTSSGVKIVSE
ncbi:MAG: deoxyribose-phosphate aldolase [Erysipelotrichia bacterium]|jgi:deoxyribose-phosphate aldolase|nr:deoxyribose-phosphate aldolase [Erysipelotrichia bacterium]